MNSEHFEMSIQSKGYNLRANVVTCIARDSGWAFVAAAVILLVRSVKCGECLDEMIYYWLLKKDSALWSA